MNNLNAGIIIIGDEVLSGRTQDTNSNFISKELVKSGIDLHEIRVIKDDEKTIIDTVLDFKKRFMYVFTTGGIGPTHDDITSESIAKAFKRKYCLSPDAYNILEKYYTGKDFSESRQKMAMMPENVDLILNPLTAAPGFIIENVYVLPGVPQILKVMFLNIIKNLKRGKPKKILTINTNLFESVIANRLGVIQKNNQECTIGSYPYFNFSSKVGGVNLVISSWTLESLDPIYEEIKSMITLLGGKYSIV